ncbi:MAG: hypothetical protein U0T69_04685 [Chitinophagales bacterium]
MKTNKTIRSIVAMMVIFFAVSTTSCKKESEISPANNNTPTVSFKPKSIVTTKDGDPGNFRLQTYEYNNQNKLTKFVSVSGSTKDSLVLIADGIGFIRKNNAAVRTKEFLSFNPDKSLKELSVSSSSGLISLSPVFVALPNSNSTLVNLANANINIGFSYLDGNLRTLSVDQESVSYTYYNNLPFQKGINELQVESTALMYHKLAEQENMTNYSLFSKLLHTVTATDRGVVRRVDTYNYVMDEHGRVVTIFLNTDFPASGSPSQQFQSTITY